MKTMWNYLFCFLLCVTSMKAQNDVSKSEFLTPPATFKMHTWWHWMGGRITKEGITKDLEAMKQQGIVQVTIINIGEIYSKEVEVPNVKFNSPEWMEMFRWALKEAERLGMTVGIQTIDGFCTTGGPWITPELSMKQYVWSKTTVAGGKELEISMEQPIKVKNYYCDVAVVAFPSNRALNTFQQANAEVRLNKLPVSNVLTDGNPKSTIECKKGDVIDICFNNCFATNKLTILPYLPFCWDDMGKITVQFTLSSSNDGVFYTKIADVGVMGANKVISASFPKTNAKYYRLELAATNFQFFSMYPIAELELLEDEEQPDFSPCLSSFFEKTASVFDVSENVLDCNVGGAVPGIPEGKIIDLTSCLSEDGILRWKAPKGNWQVIRFGYTSTGVGNDPATPEGLGLEADKMDTVAINVHMDSYAKKLLQVGEAYKGSTLKFMLLDSWEAQYQTWSKNFPVEFEKRRGYSILPWIPVLCGEIVTNSQFSEAFLHDFRKTISELINQNYYKHFSELCHRNEMELHGEAIYSNWGGYPPLDPLKANQYMDMPMTEFWAEQDVNHFAAYKPMDRPKPGFPTAASHAYGKQVIGSEAYTSFAHFTETPFDLKPFGDAAYCSGVNQLILHSFVHQPFDKKPGMTLGKFGAHFNRNNPSFDYCKDWFRYQSRVQYMLQQGDPIADVVFFAGDQLPQFFSRSFLSDLPFGIQATVCNADMLKDKAKVVDGKITFDGKHYYAMLLLPNSTKMEYETLQQIARLVHEGAVVYGPRPTEMLSLQEIKNETVAFNQLVDLLWGESAETTYGKGILISGKRIREVLNERGIIPDVMINSGVAQEIMYIHRKVVDMDIYYVFNQQNRSMNRELLFRVTDKTPEVWHPGDGTICHPAVYTIEEGGMRIPVSFKPYESKFFVFRNNKPDAFIPQVRMNGKIVFPLQQLADTLSILPQVFGENGKFTFKVDVSGDYAFTNNKGKVIMKKLSQPEVLSLKEVNTRIEFLPISGEKMASMNVNQLKSLTEFNEPSVRYFAGKAKYTMPFTVPENFIINSDSIVLNLGEFSATAEVVLNGTVIAYAWQPNTCLPVNLLKGVNKLEITVATVCRNRIIGDLIQYGSIKNLWTTSPVETILSKEMPLKPSGLMGPVRLVGYTLIKEQRF